jgi:hypothetical protein
MAFPDAIRTLANQIEERKSRVQTEEAVKQALILPFLSVLGFDIYNPDELVPEFRAGWAKQAEKIDYAVLIGKRLAIFVEAKGLNETLVNYDPQLAKYFNSTPEVKFCIITNGVQYRFFTDLQEPNLLDKKPFFEFNFEDFTEGDVQVLERFRKDVFNIEGLVGYAEDLVFLSVLKNQFMALLHQPSDDFIRFAVRASQLASTNVTQKVVDRFRPLVKESISSAILEIVGQSFRPSPSVAERPEPEPEEQAPETNSSGRIETTPEELAAFEIVRQAVSPHVPEPEKVVYNDSINYFTVRYANTFGWFARFFIQNKDKKAVTLRLSVERVQELAQGFEVEPSPATFGSSRLYFYAVDDLRKLEALFVEAAKEVVHPQGG